MLGNVTLHNIKVRHLKIRNKLERYMTNLENRERKAKHAPHNSPFEDFLQRKEDEKKKSNKRNLDFGKEGLCYVSLAMAMSLRLPRSKMGL